MYRTPASSRKDAPNRRLRAVKEKHLDIHYGICVSVSVTCAAGIGGLRREGGGLGDWA
ncbi:MAG: hypothetical protein LBS62_09100 [Clostridiales bacterium]|nr:hypothetical protein [Clostridiales bacterium]